MTSLQYIPEGDKTWRVTRGKRTIASISVNNGLILTPRRLPLDALEMDCIARFMREQIAPPRKRRRAKRKPKGVAWFERLYRLEDPRG